MTVPLLPVLQLLRSIFGISEQEQEEEIRKKIAGTLVLLDEAFKDTLSIWFDFLAVADPQQPVIRADSEDRQRKLFAMIQRLIQTMSFANRDEPLHVYGPADPQWFGQAIPLAGSAGDQHAALFGQNCTKHSMAKNTYGTGCFMLMNIGHQPIASKKKLLTTIACTATDQPDFALEGSVFIGGAAVQWLRDGLGIIKSSADVEALAASVPDSGGVYMVPAFAGLGAPHWDAYARGIIAGISRGTTAAHVARAALESIAFQVADVLDAMKEDAGIPIDELRVDGGACVNDLLMQFQADILQAPVVRPKVIETTALGAAFLAGLAVGFWTDNAEIEKLWQTERVFEPGMEADEVASRRARWNDALERSRSWEQS